MQWLAAHLPDAILWTLDGVGHFSFVEAAEAFTERGAAFVHM